MTLALSLFNLTFRLRLNKYGITLKLTGNEDYDLSEHICANTHGQMFDILLLCRDCTYLCHQEDSTDIFL